MTKLIGLMGALGSGKTTVAKHLADHHDFSRQRMAAPMKEMLKAIGLTHDQVDGKDKMVPTSLLLGKTPRHAMQTLGTEWGRDHIGPDFWVAVMQHRIVELRSCNPTTAIVIDDIRFPNEAAMIRANGGELWVVRRPAVEPPPHYWWQLWKRKPHLSEVYWRAFEPDADRIIMNDQTEVELVRQIETGLAASKIED